MGLLLYSDQVHAARSLAEEAGFEPAVRFTERTLSKRVP